MSLRLPYTTKETTMKERRFTLALLAWAGLAALTAATPLAAKSKADAFGQAVADLQDSPDDLALRRKVITLAQGLDQAPPVPDEVLVLKGKAAFVVKNAESPADYQGAVDAYNKAVLLAPWVADLYYNKGVMEEKAGQPRQASDDFNLYLFAKPDAADKDKVLERLGKLDVMLDKKKEQAKASERQQERAAQVSVDHQAWQTRKTTSTVVIVLGGIGLCAGALELGLGYGNESSSDYTVAPGVSGGVLYNKYYEGKYWSADSYNTYTQGEGQVKTGWVVGGIGLGVMVVGFIVMPGAEPTTNTGLLNIRDGKLALGVPQVQFTPYNGRRVELVHAAF